MIYRITNAAACAPFFLRYTPFSFFFMRKNPVMKYNQCHIGFCYEENLITLIKK